MRTFAISDIHGCNKTFQQLINRLQLQKEDTLYLLGDYINKGPDSKGVLDSIMNLMNEGYKLKCLKGNHDQMLLDAFNGMGLNSWQETEKQATLKSFDIHTPLDVPLKYIDFIHSMPYFFRTDSYYLVHANFNFELQDFLSDEFSMLNSKIFDIDLKKTNGKRVISGHVPQTITEIQQQINDNKYLVRIDAGCVYYKNEGLGNLIALDLDQLNFYVQENIDLPYPLSIKK